jgi:catechol 2,3-dioxygenase-like lactoylglutathione lyase family enzyme
VLRRQRDQGGAVTDLTTPILFVATTDAARSRAFYEETLGLSFVADEPSALVFDVGGTMLRIQKVERLSPAAHTVLGWSVVDVRRTIAMLRGRGVQLTRYPALPQDDDGVWTTPSGGRVAWLTDPDGNTLSLTEFPDAPARRG